MLTDAGLVDCDVRPNERAYTLNREQLRPVPVVGSMRVATEGTRTADGRLVFDFAGVSRISRARRRSSGPSSSARRRNDSTS